MTQEVQNPLQVVLERKKYHEAMSHVEFVMSQLHRLRSLGKPIDPMWLHDLHLQLRYAKDALKA